MYDEGPLVTADGIPLKQSLQNALKQKRRQAFMLTVPLLAFIFIFFMVPIIAMLWRSVDNPEVVAYLPNTVTALQQWDPEASGELPGEDVYAAMVEDLKVGRENRTITKVGRRLNYEIPGMSSLFKSSSRKAKKMEAPYKEALIKASKKWNKLDVWQLIKRESHNLTLSYFLSAMDLRFTPDGSIAAQPENRQIYVFLFQRTLIMSVVITFTVHIAWVTRSPICCRPSRCAMPAS